MNETVLLMGSDKVSLHEVTRFTPFKVVEYYIKAGIRTPNEFVIKVKDREDAVDLFVKLLMSIEGL